ncbi:MAG: NADH-quinone oxidoreductase subunit NuoI [Chloroflexi bacterium]|nr:NADH-quinone oxidoreductase subunit NuoI [Chloroflexota bacterium]
MFDELGALARGLWTTLKHGARPAVTLRYPEQKKPMLPTYRGRHRLYRHENGLERCIGCELCAGACPSQAILVVPAENDPAAPISPGERYAARYEINMIRCIFCGYCEEACPVDAIKLGPEYELADYSRESFLYTKEMLLEPEKYAPKRQLHSDVDTPRPEYTTGGRALGELYGTYHPMVRDGSDRDPESRSSAPASNHAD